jgi:hypothetical protein
MRYDDPQEKIETMASRSSVMVPLSLASSPAVITSVLRLRVVKSSGARDFLSAFKALQGDPCSPT